MILESNFDEQKWSTVLLYAKDNCDAVGFNVLYECDALDEFIDRFGEEYMQGCVSLERIYSPGRYIQFRYSDRMKLFLEKVNFDYFENNFIEDPSFYKNNIELIALVTHERYILFSDNFTDFSFFKENGFSMNVELDSF